MQLKKPTPLEAQLNDALHHINKAVQIGYYAKRCAAQQPLSPREQELLQLLEQELFTAHMAVCYIRGGIG